MVTVMQAQKRSLEKAISQLEKGGEKAHDLIEEYNKEISLCNEYLPSEDDQVDEVVRLVTEAMNASNCAGYRHIGSVIGSIMKNNVGLDGKLVREVVSKKFKE
jgi:uncharacterized protein YqeY